MTTKVDRFIWDNEDGLIIETTLYFPGMLDYLAHLRNTYARAGKPQDFRLMAHIPGVLIEDWCRKQKVSFDEFTRSDELRARMLNDPDMAAFRIWRGRA